MDPDPVTRQGYVIGSPISHSISPAIHNAAFAATDFDGHYQAVEVEPGRLAAWVEAIRTPELLGFNVTLPHKETVRSYLDAIDGDAQLTGAVNTVVSNPSNDSARTLLTGTNTDAMGFRRMLEGEADLRLEGQKILLLGAGGAARAVALVALQDGAECLWVANRHEDRARRLLADLSPANRDTTTEALPILGPRLDELMSSADIVVNATSVGLARGEVPTQSLNLTSQSLVVDLIYNPPETAFMLAARERGARVLGGLGMLVNQAAAAFERWTTLTAPISTMRAAAEEALRVRASR